VTIADSDALRARRRRAHKRGDHSLCRRCAAVTGKPEGQEGQEIPPSPGAEVWNPQAEMRQLAAQLAAAYRADPGNAALAKELRLTLQALMGGGKGSGDDDLADLFAEFSSA
jgi:hypothetical protein